jgi:hypothetical protein
MSDFKAQTINEPDLDDLLAELKNEIFATFNCVQIGKIESVNYNEQTVELKIQFKRRIGIDEIKEYPLLVDCPFVIVQGSGAFLGMPIDKGDTCLILFNDRCIDTFWDADNLAEPLTTRKHSLSDGIALIGINSKSTVLNFDGASVELNGTGFDINIKTDENVIFNDGTDFAVRYNELKTQLDQLKQDLNTFISTVFNVHTHNFNYNAGPTPASGNTLVSNSPGTETSVNFSDTKVDSINVPGVGE